MVYNLMINAVLTSAYREVNI